MFFIVALWSANSGVAALFDAFNVVYKEKEKRSLLHLYGMTFLFTFGSDGIFARGHRRSDRPATRGRVRWHVPTRRESPLDCALAGSVDVDYSLVGRTLPLWTKPPIGKVALGVLGQHGSGRAVDSYIHAVLLVCELRKLQSPLRLTWYRVGFMVWIWLSVVVILIGAELNAEMEHQTARDTTEGVEKPLGMRGAVMADRVGPAQS